MTKAFDVLDDDDACPAMEVQGDELNSNHLDIDAMLHLINPFLVPAWGNLPRF